MKKNTFLAVLLSMIVLGGWMYIQQKFAPPKTQPVKEVSANTNVESQDVSNKTNSLNSNIEVISESEGSLTEQSFILETDIVKATFTNKGGDIISYRLKEHASATGEERVEMIENVTSQNRALSLSFGNADANPVDSIFNVKQNTLSDGRKQIGFYRDFKVKNANGAGDSVFTLAKLYTFLPGDYMFTLDITIEGKDGMSGLSFGEEAYTLRSAPQIGPEWNVKEDRYEYRALSYFANGKKRGDSRVKEGSRKDVNELASWVSTSGKYFAFIIIPKDPIQKMVFSGLKYENAKVHNSQFFILRPPITGNTVKDQYRVYIGPSSEKILNIYNTAISNNYGYNDLRVDAVAASTGMLRPLEIALKWMMENLYKLIPNWGVAVILLTLIMRLIFFPLTKKSSKATKRMQELQPRITEIQTKYKSNPQKMNAEMAKFYKEAGYNPLSGCLPMLIQIPFWFAMFRLFNNYFEFRGASFVPGWIPDLSVGDSVLEFGFSLPFLGWTHLRLLPIIYVASQLLYGKLTQTPGQAGQNSSMKIMLYAMPAIFFFIFYNAPSGLLIFWIFSNVLMLLQQVMINKTMTK